MLWEPPGAPQPRSWRRQFALVPTTAQNTFDSIFGVILPVLCFMGDPVVLKGGMLIPPMYEKFQLVVYLISTVEMGAFLVWRTFPKQASGFASIFAGVFFAGAVFSAVMGLAMLPLTLFALLFVIGILGFIPFLTAFVYLRSGVRAFRVALHDPRASRRLAGMVLGATLAIALPHFATTQWEAIVSSSVNTLIYGNATEADAAARRLKRLRIIPAAYRNRIAEAYGNEFDPVKRERLRRAYDDITGKDVGAVRTIDD